MGRIANDPHRGKRKVLTLSLPEQDILRIRALARRNRRSISMQTGALIDEAWDGLSEADREAAVNAMKFTISDPDALNKVET